MSFKRCLVSVLAVLAGILCLTWASFAAELPAPTYLFTSGSARLLGMGDASVAVVDPTGYNTNPGTLALAFEEQNVVTSLRTQGQTTYNCRYASSFVAAGLRSVSRGLNNWSFALSFVNQSAVVPASVLSSSQYYSSWDGQPHMLTSPGNGVVGKGTTRTVTFGAAVNLPWKLGFGLAARQVSLDPRPLFSYAGDKQMNGWSFDLGAIARWNIPLINALGRTRNRSVTLAPAIGFSCLNLVRTRMSSFQISTYSPYLADPNNALQNPGIAARNTAYFAGSAIVRAGASVTLAIRTVQLSLIDFTGAFEHQSGRDIAVGLKWGTEYRTLETIAVCLGYGVNGIHQRVTSWGMSISTVGLQKLLFHEPVNPDGFGDRSWLWRRLHVLVSYASTLSDGRSDLPDRYWTISVSL